MYNVEGLKTLSSSSVSYIRDNLEENNMQLIILSETWLRDHLDAEVAIPNFTILRCDRERVKKRRGRNSGGAAMYLRNDIASNTEILLHFSNGVIEALCTHVHQLNLILCAVYRQPDDPAGGNRSKAEEFSNFIASLSDVLENLPTPTPNILIAGDFNLPRASWPSCTPMGGATADEKQMISILSEFCSKNFLTQIVTQPTHSAGNILDLALTNNDDAFRFLNATPTSPVSSHSLINITCNITSPLQPARTLPANSSIFDDLNLFSEDINWNNINQQFHEMDWHTKFRDLNVHEMYTVIIQTCESVLAENAPRKASRRTLKRRFVPRARRVLMRKRNKLRKQLAQTINFAKLNSIKGKLTNIERKLQDSYSAEDNFNEAKAVDAIKKNPKYFYTYAKKRCQTQSPIGPLVDTDGNLFTDPIDMANMLSNQFKSAFSSPAPVELNMDLARNTVLEDIEITKEQIERAIEEVGLNSAPGPDRFPAILLKNCKQSLSLPLQLFWRKSLDEGYIPQILRNSTITPIHKGNSRQHAKNYRPVALTSHIIKIFEKVIRNHLVLFLEQNGLMNPNQHGFRAGHSCLSQLLQHFDEVTKLLESGVNVDVIYLDFAKAFDKLDFTITLQKLFNLGISGKLWTWIRAFLSDRSQCVYIEGQKSNMETVISGVPQGSVIGPLLFLIMIRDIDDGIASSSVASFADDTRVLSGVSSDLDTLMLQADLNQIYRWAETNNATFNSEKFQCLRYGRNQDLKERTCYQSDGGSSIKSESSIRDLGVTMSDNGLFSEHIANVTKSANLKCGWVLRTFKTRNQLPLITLWRSLVLPILDYCSQLWNPSKPGLIQMLEMVQVNFLKKIRDIPKMDYWDQLKFLNMYSLQRRRERYCIIYVWKILENLVPNFGVKVGYNKRLGRYCVIPHVRQSSSGKIQTIRFGSMGVNGPRVFNCLPPQIRNLSGCSIEVFKRALDNHLKSIPDEPRVPGLIKYCAKSTNNIAMY